MRRSGLDRRGHEPGDRIPGPGGIPGPDPGLSRIPGLSRHIPGLSRISGPDPGLGDPHPDGAVGENGAHRIFLVTPPVSVQEAGYFPAQDLRQ